MAPIPRPSRFAVGSLLVLLALACGLNLYVAHRVPVIARPDVNDQFSDPDPSLSQQWPHVPVGIIDSELGEPYKFIRWRYPTHWNYVILWTDDPDVPRKEYRVISLEELRFGIPFTVRSTKVVYRDHPPPQHFLWPTQGPSAIPAATYQPLGLILNPIIYALPLWGMLMGVRWCFSTLRRRKREHLGLCRGCAYDLGGLSACPECGQARGAQAAR